MGFLTHPAGRADCTNGTLARVDSWTIFCGDAFGLPKAWDAIRRAFLSAVVPFSGTERHPVDPMWPQRALVCAF